MSLLKCYLVMNLIGICFIMGPAFASAEDAAIVSLLDKISQRIDSYPENKNYRAEIVEKNIEMNKNWEPKKTVIIKKIENSMNGMVDVEILEATETEDGNTTDITEKISEYEKKQKKNSGDNAEETTSEKKVENPFDEFFPFDETQRSEFDFHRLDDDVVDGKDVFVIESVARTKDKDRFEGKYYIDQKTLYVLKIDIKPSENPMFVKEMRMEMDFEVLPEGNFVMKKMKAKAVAKLVVKTIRQVAEVEYSNYDILHPEIQ